MGLVHDGDEMDYMSLVANWREHMKKQKFFLSGDPDILETSHHAPNAKLNQRDTLCDKDLDFPNPQ